MLVEMTTEIKEQYIIVDTARVKPMRTALQPSGMLGAVVARERTPELRPRVPPSRWHRSGAPLDEAVRRERRGVKTSIPRHGISCKAHFVIMTIMNASSQ